MKEAKSDSASSELRQFAVDLGLVDKPRILVVDDSNAVRTAVSSRLREMGLEVDEAEDAPTAMALAFARPPKVVVTDLWMPGMSGLQLCRLLRAEKATASVQVVLLTGSDDPRSRFWAKQSGASAFFAKHELAPMLDRVMRLVQSAPQSDGTPSTKGGGNPQEKLCALLDEELCASVIAGQVRNLAHAGETFGELFAALTSLAVQLLRYRFLALEVAGERFLHCDPASRAESSELAGFNGNPVRVLEDARVGGPSPTLEKVVVRFGDRVLGTLIAGGSFIESDRELLRLIARELGGPIRIVDLIAESRRHATTDSLTGLLNRRALAEAMARELALFTRHNTPLSVLMLDIDHFKRINDSYGHAVGDDALRAVAKLLRTTARRADLVARWGGEEFLLVLPATAASGSAIVAERIRLGVRMLQQDTPRNGRFTTTVSIGRASAEPNDSLETLVARADTALYQAKAKGRDRVESA